jgi:hypothetical protein
MENLQKHAKSSENIQIYFKAYDSSQLIAGPEAI